jgi:hypothetical protein
MSWWLDEELGKLGPIATAGIAVAAATIAYRALCVQRSLARKRAALDFFLKTEMDRSVVEAFHAYEDTMEKFEWHGDLKTLCENTDEYRRVCAYLNVNELIAVGVDKKLLDEDLSYDFWSDELIGAYEAGKPVIEFMRKEEDTPFSYITLEKIYKRWALRDEADRRRLSR